MLIKHKRKEKRLLLVIYLLNLILGSLEIVMSFADENISSNAMANEEKTNHMKETTANQKIS
jgi:hypothetical protein